MFDVNVLIDVDGHVADNSNMEKVRSTFYIPKDVLEAARNCIVALRNTDESLSLAKLATRALMGEIGRLQEKYNDGKPFPKRKTPMPKGRPWGS